MTFVIISAERDDLSPHINSLNTESLGEKLKFNFGLHRVSACQGVYEGVPEACYMVSLSRTYLSRTYPTYGTTILIELAEDYGQECILYVDDLLRGSLVYTKDLRWDLLDGRWSHVPDDYTGDHTRLANGERYAIMEAITEDTL